MSRQCHKTLLITTSYLIFNLIFNCVVHYPEQNNILICELVGQNECSTFIEIGNNSRIIWDISNLHHIPVVKWSLTSKWTMVCGAKMKILNYVNSWSEETLREWEVDGKNWPQRGLHLPLGIFHGGGKDPSTLKQLYFWVLIMKSQLLYTTF